MARLGGRFGGIFRWSVPIVSLVAFTDGRAVPTAAAQSGPARESRTLGWEFGGTGETIFEHTRASLRDPHFGMRLYRHAKVPGTLSMVSNPDSLDADARAAAPDGQHIFWDVAFGERAPVVGWYDIDPDRSIRNARGFQLNIDAAAFLLLDFSAQSSAVINTDYRLGLSFDARPWWDGWDRVSLSVGFFHQSTHLGDEYTLSARTIQGGAPPMVNPALPYRANPSFMAFPATVSVDLTPERFPDLTARIYGGGTLFAVSELPEATRPEARAGLEIRYAKTEVKVTPPAGLGPGPAPAPARETDAPLDATEPVPEGEVTQKMSRFLDSAKLFGLGHAAGTRTTGVQGPHAAARRLRRGARSYVLAYEALSQRKYMHDPAAPGQAVFLLGDGRWLTHHLMAMLVFNLDTERSTSNALAVSLEYLHGRNQHGQLIEYDEVRALALAFSYYW